MTVMRELIQQELEKFDREQLKQVFEFIAEIPCQISYYSRDR